jgi:post-segregation antitoxin (ccd killing protein)
LPLLARQIRKNEVASLGHAERTVNNEIRDAGLEVRIKKQLQATGSGSVEEVLRRLLKTHEEQDRWLSENREAINAKIRRGIEQLDRGEGIPEGRPEVHLARLKATYRQP